MNTATGNLLMNIKTYTEVVSIADVRGSRIAFEQQYFSENSPVRGLRDESLAALICLKKALKQAFSDLGCNAISEEDIMIAYAENASPRLVAMPIVPLNQPRSITLSVSHSADHAVGVAAVDYGAVNGR